MSESAGRLDGEPISGEAAEAIREWRRLKEAALQAFRELGRAVGKLLGEIKRLLGVCAWDSEPVAKETHPGAEVLQRPRATRLLAACGHAKNHVDGRATYLRRFH